MNFDEFIGLLQNSKIIIYGTGYVANLFYASMKERKLSGNVEGFVTTTGNNQMIDNFPVKSIDEISNDRELLVCVAVHEALKDEIINLLQEKGFENYVWIYPYQYALMLGKPIKLNCEIPVKELLKKDSEDYGLAARHLAIDEFYGKNTDGFEIYKKFIALYSERTTAEKRADKFRSLIEKWDKNGYDRTQTIGILEDGKIIDGRHRLTLACYHGLQTIACDVYPVTKKMEEIHSKATFLPEEYYEICGYSDEVVKRIKATWKKIIEKYR